MRAELWPGKQSIYQTGISDYNTQPALGSIAGLTFAVPGLASVWWLSGLSCFFTSSTAYSDGGELLGLLAIREKVCTIGITDVSKLAPSLVRTLTEGKLRSTYQRMLGMALVCA